jgi:Flp pilus assembly protein TadB
LLGYGADANRRRSARVKPKGQAGGNSRLTEFAAWLATTALAGALILLLAQFDLLLAVAVFLAYALFSVLLWRGRRRQENMQ